MKFKQRYPDKTLMLARDNGKAGDDVEENWRNFINKEIFLPNENDSDFNDQYIRLGKDSVLNSLLPQKLKPLGIWDMINLEVQEPEEINGILYRGDINVLFAPKKIGKSRFCYEMAFSIATGTRFLNFNTKKKQRVLYIDGELPDSEIQKRFRDIITRKAEVYPEIDLSNDHFRIIRYMDFKNLLGEKMNLNNPEHQKKVTEIIEDYDLVIFDSFGCVTSKRDTDSYVSHELDWRRFYYWLRDIRDTMHKTFLIIMHTTKGGDLAGTSFIANDCDNIYALSRVPERIDGAKAQFDFIYEDCRTVPLDEQDHFRVIFTGNNPTKNKGCGWKYFTGIDLMKQGVTITKIKDR